MSIDQTRAFLLAVGNLVRASAAWGEDRASGRDPEIAEKLIHAFVQEVAELGTGRALNEGEYAIIWET